MIIVLLFLGPNLHVLFGYGNFTPIRCPRVPNSRGKGGCGGGGGGKGEPGTKLYVGNLPGANLPNKIRWFGVLCERFVGLGICDEM